ncbi:2',3'-cyclic-nucleotide 2'-phosphodiesterase [Vallitalea longa]|uniref:2',3'-cyclic-nucleotide 2'-phosphodiesterase n=1 Tax=Vallitalea longa TaxID=2936439 RepID=A0A9W5YEV4_9FIRM|nr:5'-nucleotidase C-terminal domain-containing protein [Vallitalea longa]GKX29923.1 2',3'-cyclic-nucleotide 2'-phosphodiesterase [Vallitalea longa]
MKIRKPLTLLVAVLMITSMFASSALAKEVYTVKPGDVLWKIAEQYDTTWEEIAEFNELSNPHLIYPEQKLEIPSKEQIVEEPVVEEPVVEEPVAEEPVVEEPVAEDPVVEEGKKITVLGTSDVHGRIYAYEYATDSPDADAGFAKLQTLIKQEKAKDPNAILLDCGDTVQDNSAELFNDLPVHPMVQAMNSIGYDLWTLGNHEFNFDKSFLDRNIDAFSNNVLAANIYKEDGTRYVEPYKIFEKDGVRIAVVGLLPPHIPRWEASAPEHFQGLTFTQPVEEAKKVVKELQGKYDILVGAFHIGPDGEYGSQGALEIAEAVPEFNVIFCGHAHSKFSDKEVNGTKLIEPGCYGWALAKAEITVGKYGNGYVVEDVTVENIETAEVEEDKDILNEFEFVHKKSVEDANIVVGQIEEDYVKNVDYITGDAKVTTMPTAQVEDTALMDLINEVQLFYSGADISSAAAFKNDMNLVKGEFKKKDVANIYKYTNTLIGVNITGENLKKYMEWSASYYNTYKEGDVTVSFNPDIRGFNYDMFAGVDYDIDISQEAGNRIKNLTFKGEPVKDDEIYKLTINNYRFGTLKNEGFATDEDVFYDSYELIQDAGRIRALIVKYIQEEKEGKAVPTVDNNWKIIGIDLENAYKDTVFEMIKSGELTIPTSEDGRTPNVKSINANDLIEEGKLEEIKTDEELPKAS